MTIQNWLHNNFDRVVPTSDENDLRVNCPFCGDRKQHLYVAVHKQTAHCFKCEWAGTHYQLVEAVSGASSALEIWQELKNRPAQNVRDFISIADRLIAKHQQIEAVDINHMPAWFVPFCDIDLNLGYAGLILSYALKRLSYDNILHYGIGYCEDPNSPLALRMIIPIENGYYQARAITKHAAQKYMNPETPIDSIVFNPVALTNHNEVIICEGAISAIAAGTNAIATLGKKATAAQIHRLGTSGVRTFILAYDAGEERSKKTIELADSLRKYGKSVIIRAYEYGDPDSCQQYTQQPYDMVYSMQSQLNAVFNKSKSFQFAYM